MLFTTRKQDEGKITKDQARKCDGLCPPVYRANTKRETALDFSLDDRG